MPHFVLVGKSSFFEFNCPFNLSFSKIYSISTIFTNSTSQERKSTLHCITIPYFRCPISVSLRLHLPSLDRPKFTCSALDAIQQNNRCSYYMCVYFTIDVLIQFKDIVVLKLIVFAKQPGFVFFLYSHVFELNQET